MSISIPSGPHCTNLDGTVNFAYGIPHACVCIALQVRRQSRRRSEDPFAGIDYMLSRTGQPILKGAAAWFECHNRSRYPEGDHVIFVGEVERCEARPGAQPLEIGARADDAGSIQSHPSVRRADVGVVESADG